MKLVCGVGVNDVKGAVTKNELVEVDGKFKSKQTWMCPYYKTWKNMLVRCYTSLDQTYKDCTVAREWLTFSNFKAWMVTQDWKGKQLDKDILYDGNQVYSPATCVFVDPRVNTFLTERKSKSGSLPIGVYQDKGSSRFVAYGARSGCSEHLGTFDTAEEAHRAWCVLKLEEAKLVAKSINDKRVADAIVRRYENYFNESIKNVPTV